MNKEFLETFGWEIEQSPVILMKQGATIEDQNFKVISRNDNNKVLSVMSNKYCPISVTEFEKTTQRMQEMSEMELMGYQEFNDGKILLSILKNNSLSQVNSFPVEDYLILGTSYNGELPFFIGTSTILIRCQNAFSRIHMMSKTRHTKYSPDRRESIMNSLEVHFRNRKQIYQNFSEMHKVEVNEEDKIIFANKILSIPEIIPEKGLATRTMNRKEELLRCIESETNDVGNSIFGMFQGLTKYTTHSLETRKVAPFANLIGTANDLNQKGYKHCLSMIAA